MTGNNVDTRIYTRLRQTALRSAEAVGPPSFYQNNQREFKTSWESFRTNSSIKQCISYLDEAELYSGHGIPHAEAVALDAGTVIQIEGKSKNIGTELLKELIVYVQIAAVFHDIKRKEKNHTVAGSNEAKRILRDFGIDERYKQYIVDAIRNHEAFREVSESPDIFAKLISDSLYDADKFRWGPDNFTSTLWLMVEAADISLYSLYERFTENMKYIEKIKATFRTETGRKYGPEFIDMGMAIGQAVYNEMSAIVLE
jgi:hypothetical protein